MTETPVYPHGEVPPETLRKHFDTIAALMEQQQDLADDLRAAKAAASADDCKPAVLVGLIRERMKIAKRGEASVLAEDELEAEYRAKLGLP